MQNPRMLPLPNCQQRPCVTVAPRISKPLTRGFRADVQRTVQTEPNEQPAGMDGETTLASEEAACSIS